MLGLWNDVQTTPFNWLEPITTLAALAMATKRIGLIATASTTYTEAYNLARQFCSLDHISRGRIGWNIVTTWSPQAGGNFGGIGEVSHADRYERAEEYMTVVKGLWDSWADNAVLDDRASGRYADPQRVRPINHDGQVLQGQRAAEPAALAAGPAGVRASGLVGYRQAVCCPPRRGGVHRSSGEGDGESLLRRSERLGCGEGRDPSQVLILPGFSPIIGSTEAEARRFADELNELSDPEVGRNRLSLRFGGTRFLASAVGQAAGPGGFPGSEAGRGIAQPDRGDRRICPGAAADAPSVAWRSLPERAAILSSKVRRSRWPI